MDWLRKLFGRKSHAENFIFAIPLIPQHRSHDWDTVIRKLRSTLRAALNQTDSNFQILLSTEDEIDIPEAHDPRLVWLPLKHQQLNNEANRSHSAATRDMNSRRDQMLKEARRRGAKYLMFLDADDLVSSKLIETIRSLPASSGYALTQGFVRDDATGNILPCPSDKMEVSGFDIFCGSSLVFSLKRKRGYPKPWPEAIVRLGHHRARKVLVGTVAPMYEIKTPLAIYVLNTGMNISLGATSDGPHRDYVARVAQAAATHGRAMTATELHEFGLMT